MRELTDHIVSDKVVYIGELSEGEREDFAADCIDWLTEFHEGRVYLQLKIVFFGQRDSYFLALLNVANPGNRDTGGNARNRNCGTAHSQQAMLVSVAELVQPPKGMTLKICPTLIRLKRFDDFSGSFRDIPDTFSKPAFGVFKSVFMDRERRIPIGRIRFEQRQLPNSMVKGGPEMIGDFSDQERDQRRNGFKFDAADMYSFFRIVISREGIWPIFEKGFNDGVEFVEMVFCPSEFEINVL